MRLRTRLLGPKFTDAYLVDAGAAQLAVFLADQDRRILRGAKKDRAAAEMLAALYERHPRVLARMPVREGDAVARLPLPRRWDDVRMVEGLLAVARTDPFDDGKVPADRRRVALGVLAERWDLDGALGCVVHDVLLDAVSAHAPRRNGARLAMIAGAAVLVAVTHGASLPHAIGGTVGLKGAAATKFGLAKLGGGHFAQGHAMANGQWLLDQTQRRAVKATLRGTASWLAADGTPQPEILTAELAALQARTAVIDWLMLGDEDAIGAVIESLAEARAVESAAASGAQAREVERAFERAIDFLAAVPSTYAPLAR